jgi:hypothetical protein
VVSRANLNFWVAGDPGVNGLARNNAWSKLHALASVADSKLTGFLIIVLPFLARAIAE